MPKINTYTDNATIEDVDAVLTYDPSGSGATKLTTFARIASWVSAKLAALGKKTAISSADQILMVNGSAAARIDYNVLAKAIIEQYAGSTVAGSAQSVKAALDALNSKLGLSVITSGDANDLTETGISRVYNISNLPDGASIANVFTIKYSADWISQIAFVLSPDAPRGAHVRQYVGGTTWTAWTKL